MEDTCRSLDTPSVLQIEPYPELWAYEACHHRGRDHCPRKFEGIGYSGLRVTRPKPPRSSLPTKIRLWPFELELSHIETSDLSLK